MKRFFPLAALIGTLACSGASFTGKVNGISFSPRDAMFRSVHYAADANAGLPGVASVGIALTDTGHACSDAQASTTHPGESTLYMGLTVLAPEFGIVPVGTYTIDPNYVSDPNGKSHASASFYKYDSGCSLVSELREDPRAVSGSIKVTESTGSVLAADFDLTIGTSRVTGSFAADVCPGFPGGAARTTAEFFNPPAPGALSSSLTQVCKPQR